MTQGKRRVSSLLAGLSVVGLIGFGGGSALIPVVDKEIVQRRGLLDDHTYTRHTIVANITPGALPVKLAAAAGQTVRGPWLALLAALVVALPGVLGTLGLMAAADSLGPAGVRVISDASVGIAAFIIVLLIGYILKVHKHAGRRFRRYVAITVVAALATGSREILALLGALVGVHDMPRPPRLNAVQLILTSLAIIVVVALVRDRRAAAHPPGEPRGPRRMGRVWLAAASFAGLALAGTAVFTALQGLAGLRLAGLLAFSSVTSFGGGEAYIGVADGFFVAEGLVDREVFYTRLVPIANALPGPILVKVGAGIGYLAGTATGSWPAWVLGLAAMTVTVGACCAVAMPVLGMYEELRDHPVVRSIGTYILPVICGLLVAVSATMLEVSAGVARSAGKDPTVVLWASVAALVVMTWLHLRTKVPDLLLLAVAGVISLVLLGL